MSQQPVVQQPKPTKRRWNTEIMSCSDDFETCMCVALCCPFAAYQISHDMDESPCLPFCVPGFLITLRTKFRTQQNIEGSICNDCILATFCCPCALCQLMREQKATRP